ncbi:MAG: ATP-dependent metallopeptidase FtsH/Yme1/Tma family protein [Acidobacteria bacterium]|nr:ATP-dependent metallopeptidase FtsH/Yme1/Tma family protein [Acidobacteriota bacterium]
MALLLPPACREEVLGDLHERFRSPAAYALDALRTVPLVILSRIRRTADPGILLMQALALYLAFLAAARLAAPSLIQDQLGLPRLAFPAVMALLGLILDDAYARPGPRSGLHLMRGPVLGAALALLVSQETLPRWVALEGCALALVFSGAIRLWFPPLAMRAAGPKQTDPGHTEFPMPSKTRLAFFCALMICGAIVISILTTHRPSRGAVTYSEFLDRLQNGQVASVVIDAARSGAVEATLRLKDGGSARTVLPADYRDALRSMRDHLVNVEVRDSGAGVGQMLLKAAPFLALLGVWIVLIIRKAGGQPLPG